MNICPSCLHDNMAGILLCGVCGKVMQVRRDDKTLRVEDLPEEFIDRLDALSPDRSGHFGQGNTLVVHFHEADKSLTLRPTKAIIFGRSAAGSLRQSDVDLTPYDAYEKGVSRIHAALDRDEAWLTLVDLGSSNGTRVNGLALRPHEPAVLQDSDVIQMGKLVLSVYFTSSEADE